MKRVEEGTTLQGSRSHSGRVNAHLPIRLPLPSRCLFCEAGTSSRDVPARTAGGTDGPRCSISQGAVASRSTRSGRRSAHRTFLCAKLNPGWSPPAASCIGSRKRCASRHPAAQVLRIQVIKCQQFHRKSAWHTFCTPSPESKANVLHGKGRITFMRSIMLTYPGFGSLPTGLKKLLLESENFFFEELKFPADRSLVLGREPQIRNGNLPFDSSWSRDAHQVSFAA